MLNRQTWISGKDARIVLPQGKRPVTLRIDRDVLEWFRSHGPRYQSRMNAVVICGSSLQS